MIVHLEIKLRPKQRNSTIMKQKKEITDQNANNAATILNKLLADEYVLFTKTRNTHWNIDGSNFFELHVFLENQYNALDVMIDDIAEQIHSLGHIAIGFRDFLTVSNMSEDNHDFSNSGQIIQTLINDHETIIRTIRNDIHSLSDRYMGTGIAEFAKGLMKQHEKMARKLKIFLPNPDQGKMKHDQTVNKQSIRLQA